MGGNDKVLLAVLAIVALLTSCLRLPEENPPDLGLTVSIEGVKLGDQPRTVGLRLGKPTHEECGPITCDPSRYWVFNNGPAIRFGVYAPGATEIEGFVVEVNGQQFPLGGLRSEWQKLLGPPDAQHVFARHDFAEDVYCDWNLVIRHRGGKLKRAWLVQDFAIVSDDEGKIVKTKPDSAWQPRPLSETNGWVLGDLLTAPR